MGLFFTVFFNEELFFELFFLEKKLKNKNVIKNKSPKDIFSENSFFDP